MQMTSSICLAILCFTITWNVLMVMCIVAFTANQLLPQRRVLQKTTAARLFNKCYDFYRTRRFSAMFAIASNSSLIWTSPFHLVFICRFNIILSPMLRPSNWCFGFRFCDQIVVCIPYLCETCHILRQSHSPSFAQPTLMQWKIQVVKPLCNLRLIHRTYFSPRCWHV
jgi:hypothetical protein